MLADFQHKCNQEAKQRLESLGFDFNITADGYEVRYRNEWVAGASVMLPREKPLHWKHRIANLRDNLNSAVIAAQRKHVYR
jgi:hypothetical protein